MTYQAIADASGMSGRTVRRAVGANAQTDCVTGKDGKGLSGDARDLFKAAKLGINAYLQKYPETPWAEVERGLIMLVETVLHENGKDDPAE